MSRTQFDKGAPGSRRLSYANVMATLALFVALGGTSYAVTQINGNQITNRSIGGGKLKPHTLTAQELHTRSILGQDLKLHTVTAQELRDLVVSTGHPLRRAKATADTGSSNTTSTVIPLSIGQSATVLQSDPFSYIANCTAGSDGQPLVSIQAESSETGSLLQGAVTSSGQELFPEPYPLTAGQPVYTEGPVSTPWGFLINGAHLIAPSGAALIVNLSFGTNLYGAQCWASGFGVG